MNQDSLQADLLRRAEARLPDDALRAVRRSFLAEVANSGFPTTRDEDWRYTNLSPAVKLSNSWLHEILGGAAATSKDTPPTLPDLDAHCLLLLDGLVDEVTLRRLQERGDAGLRVRRLRDCARSVVADGALDELNAAMLQDGVHITVEANYRADKPLAIFFEDGELTASQGRVIIDVEPNATIDLVEYHLGGQDREHFANTVIQLNLQAGASANLVRLQRRSRKHVQVGKLAVTLHGNAEFAHAAFDFGGGLVRNDIFAKIQDAGAAVRMHGLYLADGKQHIDNHTRVDHLTGPAVSREEYRGILNGYARCVFNGKALVHKGADGTDAQQENHNLLLSRNAEIDTKPELEIYADDVKCAHGATVGELDEEAIFYLRSRGLDPDQAAHMLTRAFAARVLSNLPVASLRGHIETLIDARLNEMLQDKTS